MRTTIDAAGRVVLPADVRDALGLAAGSEVDLVLIDGRIEITIAAVEGTVSVEDGWPQLTPTRADQPTLDDQTVQDTIRINRR
ncbi:MAG: AbrB/MazE/SpoVT family DNA-binding domain-containing protein [Actinomycetales bacterium]|mgnify:FL=1|jgi:AbrB family looped-hinge helix DNA binding protein|uniref:AbrB/MazE/SpoVT family DNA-binding domain-containing protein n=1 Tax=Candidatus Phosphoribacter hodrii TaxID=2953743 RepID=A0A935IK91_9MICO|nr:AbrB/MazE/SpoVT family DNA-binding domain-containing protein [Candidatus Phosphoribacter hodrii]HBX81761.1 antitoxin [Propionibacteriaceae bacterium]HOA03838.1 AbrB/MazE/SpoVT family DNA-binding domain-containing protein [Dermatophilaceae bacterium]MBK7272731.1 AbrB/MazE/SpoVT family DNA-binding domain-containing protein [Candidatus Phosphoribacter hodrii]MBL0004905.1 AbrB/MazE/SpoVT family DNA-binding domain-containing protein [Candidatus Phosphoribacter hodrii]